MCAAVHDLPERSVANGTHGHTALKKAGRILDGTGDNDAARRPLLPWPSEDDAAARVLPLLQVTQETVFRKEQLSAVVTSVSNATKHATAHQRPSADLRNDRGVTPATTQQGSEFDEC